MVTTFRIKAEELTEELLKKIPVHRRTEPDKKKWIPWGLAGVFALFMIWLIDLFLHFIDKLLKGQL